MAYFFYFSLAPPSPTLALVLYKSPEQRAKELIEGPALSQEEEDDTTEQDNAYRDTKVANRDGPLLTHTALDKSDVPMEVL